MSRDVYVLGVSMSRHDRAACLLKNGSVVGAIAEERLDRRKRSLGKYGPAAGHIGLPPLAAIAALDLFGATLLAKPAGVVTRRENA